ELEETDTITPELMDTESPEEDNAAADSTEEVAESSPQAPVVGPPPRTPGPIKPESEWTFDDFFEDSGVAGPALDSTSESEDLAGETPAEVEETDESAEQAGDDTEFDFGMLAAEDTAESE